MKILAGKQDLEALVGFGAAKASRLERLGLFPRRRQIGPGRVGWVVEELVEWARKLPLGDGRMRGHGEKEGP